MAVQGTIDVIREALADSDGVQLDRLELVLDDGAVVLRGAVSTTEQASMAAMVAEQHADEVRNLLSVDPGLREDADPTRVADDAALRAADGAPRDDLTTDVFEALGENVAWDPPTQPHLAPTEDEQRGLLARDQEPDAMAEPAAPADAAASKSLPDLSQADLERDAHPGD